MILLASLFLSPWIAIGAEKEKKTRQDWYNGTWDSTIYNLMEHPRTVGVRIEVVDAETRLPVRGANVRVTGTYSEERVGMSGDDVGIPREPQEREFRLSATTGKDGVTVFALGWQKEYPWRSYFGEHPPRDYKKGKSGSYTSKRSWIRAVDDIEKAQKTEIRHPRYQYAETRLGFARFLDVGQQKKSSTQRPAIFDKFEKAWHAEIKRDNVKFYVLDLGKKFPDFGNKKSKRIEFFDKIRSEDYGKLYTKPQNWFSKGDHPQSLCGPYFVYLFEIRLKRRSGQIDVNVRGGQSARRQARKDQEIESGSHATKPAADKEQPRTAGTQLTEVQRKRRQQLREKAGQSPLRMAVRTMTSAFRKKMGLYPGTKGVIVEYIQPDSPAAKAGLHPGIVIESIDHRTVSNESDLAKRLNTKKPGDQILIGFWMKGQKSKWTRHLRIIRLIASEVASTRPAE
jgi:hypothetical protein